MSKLISTFLSKKTVFAYVVTALVGGIVTAALKTAQKKAVDGEVVEEKAVETVETSSENHPEGKSSPATVNRATKVVKAAASTNSSADPNAIS